MTIAQLDVLHIEGEGGRTRASDGECEGEGERVRLSEGESEGEGETVSLSMRVSRRG